jgi:hypothetical protein
MVSVSNLTGGLILQASTLRYRKNLSHSQKSLIPAAKKRFEYLDMMCTMWLVSVLVLCGLVVGVVAEKVLRFSTVPGFGDYKPKAEIPLQNMFDYIRPQNQTFQIKTSKKGFIIQEAEDKDNLGKLGNSFRDFKKVEFFMKMSCTLYTIYTQM